ncbi:MAG: cytochrome C [Gammaproteobacteria bacterium]|nr:cytochrome C [Gammaproteobacteria bacterium]
MERQQPTHAGPRPAALVYALVLAAGLLGTSAVVAEGILESRECSRCHRLTVPAAEDRTVAALSQRKAPDLFYAGSKFRPEWLRQWLLAPERIRPAGVTPYLHAQTVDGRDRLQDTDLEPHPAVAEADVDEIVEALQALDWGTERLPRSMPAAPPVPRMLAQMNFVKFKGCASCHRISPDFGGLSGPQLYTAADRLRPEFLTSYIADPQAWDPVAPMPGYGLPPVEVAKLVRYLDLISKEHGDASTR